MQLPIGNILDTKLLIQFLICINLERKMLVQLKKPIFKKINPLSTLSIK